MNDPLLLGGKAFSSRFILGSGKFSLPLIQAAVEQAGAEIVTLALRRAKPRGAKPISWTTSPSRSLCCPTPLEPVPLRRRCALPGWHGNAAAEPLLNLR